ncbi:lipase [Actinoplanes sp. NPDC051851]|uniref:esterase/lipase family protein n=1 Tax=Actinoplanes sp. NPDC051851 TaxID=3154753 RepID=UPI00342FCCC0
MRVMLTLGAIIAALFPGAGAAAAPAPGIPLSVPRARLDGALHCTGDLAGTRRSGRAPVLLVHGTTSTARANFSWNWDRALDAGHRAHCDVDLPESGNGDIQTAAEYVVHGIRRMHAVAGGRISLVGHSQGGMIGRWALKYWPDTRRMVDDYVSLASSNHGTDEFAVQCGATRSCSAAYWQQRTGSAFLTALNTGPQIWPGISYTQIMTEHDEIILPYARSALPPSALVANVRVQDLCRYETVEHFGMAYDNAAWLLGEDALTHPGPVRPSRTNRATCGWPLMPSVDPLAFPANAAAALAQSTTSMLTAPMFAAEPPLRAYARG